MNLSYDHIAGIYDELYGAEQEAKHTVVLKVAPPHGTVLDVGCGTGRFLIRLREYSVGVDISLSMLNIAKKRVSHSLVDLVLSDARLLPFRSEVFDTVYSITVVHEAPNSIREILRVLKTGGWAVITLLKKRREMLEFITLSLKSFPHKVIDEELLKDVIVVVRKIQRKG